MASVFLTYCSKVLIPRSQRITFGLPSANMYSAARRNSSIVADMPRLRKIGFLVRPTSLNNMKFCMLRAPICRMSQCLQTRSMSRGSRTSVQVAIPWRRPASSRSFSPSAPRPWNAYGPVRGLKAPPRRSFTPNFSRLPATDSI